MANSRCSTERRSRPLRPIERQPMGEWLHGILESDEVAGVSWLSRQNGEFKIHWCHGSRHGWTIKHAHIFERWARHTGRYSEAKKDTTRWKANFRCAIRSLKDVVEVKEKSITKGTNAFRVYKFDGDKYGMKGKRMPKVQTETPAKLTGRINRKTRTVSTVKVEDDTDGMKNIGHVTMPTDDALSVFATQPPQLAIASRLPNFEKISSGLGKVEFGRMHRLPLHGSGYTVQVGDRPKSPTQILWFPSAVANLTHTVTCDSTQSTLSDGPMTPYSDTQTIVYPETPEDSAGSPMSGYMTSDEEMVQLYEVEVGEDDMNVTESVGPASVIEQSIDFWGGQELPLSPPYED